MACISIASGFLDKTMPEDEKKTLNGGVGLKAHVNETLTGGIGAAGSDATLTKIPGAQFVRQAYKAEWSIGDVIEDKYEVTDFVGRGGMGIVYKVYHREWRIDMAVKMPLAGLVADEASKARFIREAQTWVDLGLHPNIVQCWYVRDIGNIPRVFMDFMKGGSLKCWLEKGKVKPGDRDQIIDLMIQACDGLGYAHAKGVVHRDVKAANMLMRDDGRLCITDFGIVKLIEVKDIADEKTSGEPIHLPFTVTAVGSNLGTPEYGAPELWGRAEYADTRTDIYSLGVVLYELCCGRRPFDDGTRNDPAHVIIGRHISAPVPPPAEFNSGIPKDLSELILQCLAKEPEKRPANTGELRDNLVGLFEVKGRSYFRKKPQSADLIADTMNNKAVSLWDLGYRNKAVTVLKDALFADPHHLSATYNLATIDWHRGEITDLEVISRLESLNISAENSALLNYLLGLCHLERGALDRSKALLKKAVNQKPGAHSYWKTLGRVCLITNDINGATGAFRQSANLEHHDRESQSIYEFLLSVKPSAEISARIAGKLPLNNTATRQLRPHEPETKPDNRFGYNIFDSEGAFIKDKIILAVDAENDRALVPMSSENRIALADFSGTRPFQVINHSDFDYILDACFSSDGKLILLRGPDKMAVWNSEFLKFKNVIPFDPDEINIEDISPRSAAIHPNGSAYVIDQGLPGEPPMICTAFPGDIRLVPLCVGHTDHINSVGLDSKHNRILTSSRDGTAKLWDATSGVCRLTIESNGILSANFSPCGNRIMTFSRTGEAVLWDISNFDENGIRGGVEGGEIKRKLKVFNTHPDYPIHGVADPSFSMLATWNKYWSKEKGRSLPGPIRIWHIETGQCLRSFPNYNPSYNGSLEFIDSGSRLRLVAFSAAIGFLAWELPSWQQEAGLEICKSTSVTEVIAQKAEIDRLIARAENLLDQKKFGEAYDRARSAQKFAGHEFDPRVMKILKAVYPYGRRVKLNRYWNVKTVWSADKKPVTAFGFLKEKKVISGTAYGALQVWDFNTGRCLKKLIGHYNPIVSIIAVPTAGLFVSIDQESDIRENNMRVWDSTSYRCVTYLKAYGDVFRSLAVSIDGTMAVSVDGKNKLYIWDIEIEELDYTIDIQKEIGKIYSISIEEGNEHVLLQWDQNKWLDVNLKDRTTSDKTLEDKDFIPENGIYPRLSIQGNTVRVENKKTGALFSELGGHHEKVLSCAISEDHRTVISGDESGRILHTELDWELLFGEEETRKLSRQACGILDKSTANAKNHVSPVDKSCKPTHLAANRQHKKYKSYDAATEKAAEKILNRMPDSKAGKKLWKKARKQQGKSIDVDITADRKKEILKTYFRYDSNYSTDKITRALGSDPRRFGREILFYDSDQLPRDRVISEYNLKPFEFDLILNEGKRAAWLVKDQPGAETGSRVAYRDSLNCQYCHEANIAPFWPQDVDFKPFYCQDRARTIEKPGAFRLPVQCPHCDETWYVVWDDDPDPVAGQFLVHIERMCAQYKEYHYAHQIWRSMVTDRILGKIIQLLGKEAKRAADQKTMNENDFVSDVFFNILTIVPAVGLSDVQTYLGGPYLQYLQNHCLIRWDKSAYHLANWIVCVDGESTLLNLQFFPRDDDIKKAPTVFPADLLTSEEQRLIALV